MAGMNCPDCNYVMTDFDADCPRCHGQGLAVPQRVPTQSLPVARSPVNDPNLGPQQDAKAVLSQLGRSLVHEVMVGLAMIGLIVLVVIVANWTTITKLLDGDPATISNTQQALQKAARPQSESVPSSPSQAPPVVMSKECGAMNAAECAWVQNAARILDSVVNIDKRAGESDYVLTTRREAAADQAQADMMRLQPIPPRCFRAYTLTNEAIGEVWLMCRAFKRAIDFNSEPTAQEARKRRIRSAELMGECAAEFQRLYNSP